MIRSLPAKRLSFTELPFRLPPAEEEGEFIRKHLSGPRWSEEKTSFSFLREYYDTFDWRLYRRGLTLERRTGSGRPRLFLAERAGGRCRLTAASPPPRFVRDTEDDQLRTELEPIVEMRAILPVAAIRSARREFVRRNKNGKIIVRAVLEKNTVMPGEGGRKLPLPLRVVVVPVKGYRKAFRKLAEGLQEELSLEVAPNLLEEALQTQGTVPGRYEAKPEVSLVPGMPAWLATRKILRRLLSVMEQNEQGIREDVDTEFLHDFRVAVRSTRAIMRQMREVFPHAAIVRFQPEFSWLGTITGPTRDLDVYLLEFQNFCGLLPANMREHLEPLRDFLQRQQGIAQQILAEKLKSPRYRRLIREWRAFLESEEGEEDLPLPPVRTVGELAGARLRKLVRRTMKKGKAITDGSPPEELHELRKTCKKLRYMMEFYRSLYPRREIDALIKPLKGLQNCLGSFQDFQIHKNALAGFRSGMEAECCLSADTTRAMDLLVERMEREQAKARLQFKGRFDRFARVKNRTRAKTLFPPPENPQNSSGGPE